nr:hypothetical protein [Candidatus Sigynarchaeota archaeon]
MTPVTFDPRVFKVNDPPCSKCHENGMDFHLHKNFSGLGMDWLQWFCKNSDCGYYINVEIL